jgi:hypothetical protein
LPGCKAGSLVHLFGRGREFRFGGVIIAGKE